VRYYSGPDSFYEWMTLEHDGPAREIAVEKWEALAASFLRRRRSRRRSVGNASYAAMSKSACNPTVNGSA
jgi:hypothetical protein